MIEEGGFMHEELVVTLIEPVDFDQREVGT